MFFFPDVSIQLFYVYYLTNFLVPAFNNINSSKFDI